MVDLTVKRTGNRTWWAELDWLLGKGYKVAFNGLEAAAIESTACSRCGHHRMEYRGFSIPGIVNRSYALCDMCEHWVEF